MKTKNEISWKMEYLEILKLKVPKMLNLWNIFKKFINPLVIWCLKSVSTAT